MNVFSFCLNMKKDVIFISYNVFFLVFNSIYAILGSPENLIMRNF